MKHTKYAASVAFCAICAAPAVSQEAFELDQITVFANQAEREVSRTGATVEVVTEEELREAGDVRIGEFLSRLPGVSFSSSGGIGANAGIRLRGLPDRYVAVRVDGIDVTDPSSVQTQFNFGTLTTSGVSRIEILKGAQSALYGSEAIGGVINITTNRATEPGTKTTVELEAGSYGTAQGAVNVSTLTDRGESAVTLSRITTDGFSAADENEGNTEDDAHSATRLSFSGAYDVTDVVTLGLSGFWEESKSEYDEFLGSGIGTGDGTPDELAENKTYGLRAFAEVTGATVDHSFSVSRFDIDRKVTSNGLFTGFVLETLEFEGERLEMAYKAQTDLSERLTLSYGADWTR